ncbi:PadR family transcriptional regulator (plasmid) [Deinococcus sp. KNUC1210]|uniref:PadR family transcriptional regulator n=1 Tax=Deinococcus sp. KNUC1210 TaxID=2917691 RepID=UPI001EEFD253|nr:PadR family transcriptional regulator [Deinococcus sp. KNUC1210]ULH14003.1 PadR family transcriptional regulator [Deinococcus sp. KNUC1210]
MPSPSSNSPDANLLRGHLDLILLSIIQGEPKYGLEISKQAQVRTQGYFDLKVGSLYPALHRLEKAGFIRSEFQTAPRSGSPVKAYALTESGERELAARRREFETFAQQLGKLWPLGGEE